MNVARARTLGTFAAVVLFCVLTAAGCGKGTENEGSLATISVNRDSSYEKTFAELHLGRLFDFKLKRTMADETWVTLWVEGYRDGKETTPHRLVEFSYGRSPSSEVEGPLGFGIVDNQGDVPSLFLYAEGGAVTPHRIDALSDWNEPAGSTWGYAIGDEAIGLAPGETKLLAYYRKVAGNGIHTYDVTDPEELAEMIRKDKTVLLLKMKAEVADRP